MKIFRCMSEIIFAMFLVYISYFAWDRIDVEAYEKYISQYKLTDLSLTLDSDFNLAYMRDKNSIDESVLSINNYQDKKYKADILLELNNIDKEIFNNLILVINSSEYYLSDIYKFEEDDKYYFLIDYVELCEYEKKDYKCNIDYGAVCYDGIINRLH